MPKRWTPLVILGALLAAANMGDDGCDDWDQDYECSVACDHLAECENAWLIEDGKEPLDPDPDDGEPTHAMNVYTATCEDDCSLGGDEDEISCIQESSCDELRDGRCAD